MAKRPVEEILSSVKPLKSQKFYEKAWTEFKTYIEKEEKPEEHDFIQYFSKGFASSSIWSHFSMLNNMSSFCMYKCMQICAYVQIICSIKKFSMTYKVVHDI